MRKLEKSDYCRCPYLLKQECYSKAEVMPTCHASGLEKEKANFFVSCSDEISARGMRVLGNPLPGDSAVTAGESGAVPVGFLYEVIQNLHYQDLKTSPALSVLPRLKMVFRLTMCRQFTPAALLV